ncbi:hypothetical protein [Halorhabdus amylolytica]|uniref:hypothetical protein n=1 Tax=Halorhabdus amylolytica TaxID=2559573 RepID=UPI0010AA0CA7|nr:hypothetical protein [Halorhabdus amylolytica]
MTTIFGVFDAQAFVVLIIAVVGLAPVLLYRTKTSRWFLFAYAFLFVAAFTTNFENVLLPEVLNLVEHIVGNMGTGIAFAVAAYMYRRQTITADAETGEAPEA